MRKLLFHLKQDLTAPGARATHSQCQHSGSPLLRQDGHQVARLIKQRKPSASIREKYCHLEMWPSSSLLLGGSIQFHRKTGDQNWSTLVAKAVSHGTQI